MAWRRPPCPHPVRSITGVVCARAYNLPGRTPPCRRTRMRGRMTKHSKRERERRAEETQRVREIESAWAGSVPPATAKAFAMEVEAALARGPEVRRPDMAP